MGDFDDLFVQPIPRHEAVAFLSALQKMAAHNPRPVSLRTMGRVKAAFGVPEKVPPEQVILQEQAGQLAQAQNESAALYQQLEEQNQVIDEHAQAAEEAQAQAADLEQQLAQAQQAAQQQQDMAAQQMAQVQQQLAMSQSQAQLAQTSAQQQATAAAQQADMKSRLAIRIQQIRKQLSDLAAQDPVNEEGATADPITTGVQDGTQDPNAGADDPSAAQDPNADPAGQQASAPGQEPQQAPAPPKTAGHQRAKRAAKKLDGSTAPALEPAVSLLLQQAAGELYGHENVSTIVHSGPNGELEHNGYFGVQHGDKYFSVGPRDYGHLHPNVKDHRPTLPTIDEARAHLKAFGRAKHASAALRDRADRNAAAGGAVAGGAASAALAAAGRAHYGRRFPVGPGGAAAIGTALGAAHGIARHRHGELVKDLAEERALDKARRDRAAKALEQQHTKKSAAELELSDDLLTRLYRL